MNDDTTTTGTSRAGTLRLRRWAASVLAALLFASPLLAAGALLATAPGCRQLRQVANLRDVDFAIEDVDRAELAGIDLDQIRNPEDVGFADIGRLGTALARGEMPMSFTLVLGADNPAENSVDARLVEMDWTLMLEDRETISGTFDERLLLPSGRNTRIPIDMRLDLLDFFDRGGQDLFELALNIAGLGGEPKDLSLRARPTIETPVGPIRYPGAITIRAGEVGRDDVDF